MRVDKYDLNLLLMLLATLVLPIGVGFFMNSFSEWRFVSIPLHSTVETIGGTIAFLLTGMIFVMYHTQLELNRFHRASFALIAMGVFDIFHAIVAPGELFVWLHSLAIFFGGALFTFVWFENIQVSSKRYYYAPIIIFIISFVIAVFSILNPSLLPQMLDSQQEFTDTANLLNLMGGALFFLASLYFIKRYIEDGDFDDLLFIGHTMLFGSAGILFFFSSIWDMQWWFWHTLRLLAYLVSLYFMFEFFHKNLKQLEYSHTLISSNNEELQKSVKLLRQYKNAIYSGSIISTSDLRGNIIDVNDELLQLTGYDRGEIIGKGHNIFRDPSTPKVYFKEMWETIQKGEIYRGLIKNRKKNKDPFYAKITIIPIIDDKGKVFEYVAFREDVTELVASQSELKKTFYTDSLTGIFNRFKLSEDLKEFQHSHIALLNLDNFKSINDFYGQDFGDEVLKEISTILLTISYEKNYRLYRNHGDEFALITLQKEPFTVFHDTIVTIVRSIENTKLHINDHEIEVSLSAGLVSSGGDVVKADMALKEAKSTKKAVINYHDNLQTQTQFASNILWSKKIKEALLEDRIEIALQPLYSNVNHRIEKYEALMRLIETNGEVISPIEFLDVAKRTKLYPQLTRRVIKKAFGLLPLTSKSISINITAEDIFDEETNLYLMNMIRNSSNAHQLVIELVESEGIENFSIVKEFIDEIKKYQVKLAIDDFGTGYSNFEYLLKLNADFIKIDGSMIKNIDHDPNSYNVVETIVMFAKKNTMEVIAEFVSNAKIQEKVVELGIEYSQGYFIDKPKLWEEIQ